MIVFGLTSAVKKDIYSRLRQGVRRIQSQQTKSLSIFHLPFSECPLVTKSELSISIFLSLSLSLFSKSPNPIPLQPNPPSSLIKATHSHQSPQNKKNAIRTLTHTPLPPRPHLHHPNTTSQPTHREMYSSRHGQQLQCRRDQRVLRHWDMYHDPDLRWRIAESAICLYSWWNIVGRDACAELRVREEDECCCRDEIGGRMDDVMVEDEMGD